MITSDIEDLISCYRKQQFPDESVESISFKRSQLLSWYRENRRLLPWRGDNTSITPSPYGTWISEIMLQQTRVETVIDYWKRWMETFPTLESLSQATPDDVNRLWAGLGYYRRAQQLLKGAQFVMKEFNGIIPSNVDELLKIPGIGPYTAGAIASIAFGKAVPLVDGNVIRVFARLYGITAEIGASGNVMEKHCWSIAGKLVDPVDPGAFNQSLMELGATVCKPTSPSCSTCPVRSVCVAKALVDYRLGDTNRSTVVDDLPTEVTVFPRKVAKKKPVEVLLSVCVLVARTVKNGEEQVKYLFSRRPEKGLLANQWEFPCVTLEERVNEDEEDVDETDEAMPTKTTNIPTFSESELWSPLQKHLQSKFRFHLINSHDQADHDVALRKLHTVSSSVSYSRLQTEPIVHIFSHQRHTMYISVKHVDVDDGSESILDDVTTSGGRWMSAVEITSEGITTGCKKILQEVIKCTTTKTMSSVTTEGKTVTKKRKPTVKEESALVVVDLTDIKEEEEEKELPKKQYANAFEKMLSAQNSSGSSKKAKQIK